MKRTQEQNIYVKYRDANDTPIKVRLTTQNDHTKFLALSTIEKESSVGFVRNMLGIKNYSKGAKPKLPPPT